MKAIEVKDRDQHFSWEFVGIYIAPKEYMRVMERLVPQTGCRGNYTKRIIIEGDLT
jgi:hypothetical protein